MKSLRCYFAGHRDPDEYVYVDACFAHSYREARALLWSNGTEIRHVCDGRYFDMRVHHQSQHDALAEKHGITESGVMHRPEILRDMGWRIEGDAQCGHCEKFSYDGQWPVCGHCEQCDECGHAGDCPERQREQAGSNPIRPYPSACKEAI